ncbi:nucleotide pyrophosphohydrolase [Natronolimnobius sp. AArcel1]|uniref:MazG nucleotide pyrophosphohydrolase domain-containing protein n=1 Tax=Natronolimnobius sp. AArcel1 TaxID=1679093 RepID=UPI0013EC7D53|nr:MazG-like family protein [Natronolimnobius sp. AArcel1]NGM68941.1 nucleotide pyrophosphohydrolase [Natronolimnobius sp. AArcel1]
MDLPDAQAAVADFVKTHNLEIPPEYRLLDLVSEIGELAKDANTSTGYGASPDDLTIESDEIGDVLFALLALADDLEIDANAALEEALEKYEERLAATGEESPGSGE